MVQAYLKKWWVESDFLVSEMIKVFRSLWQYWIAIETRILFFTIIFPVLLYTTLFIVSPIEYHSSMLYLDRRGRDRMVVFTTTYVIGAYHHWCCGFDSHSGLSIRHYVIKFVNDLRLVGSFLRVLLFSLLIKLTATI